MPGRSKWYTSTFDIYYVYGKILFLRETQRGWTLNHGKVLDSVGQANLDDKRKKKLKKIEKNVQRK